MSRSFSFLTNGVFCDTRAGEQGKGKRNEWHEKKPNRGVFQHTHQSSHDGAKETKKRENTGVLVALSYHIAKKKLGWGPCINILAGAVDKAKHHSTSTPLSLGSAADHLRDYCLEMTPLFTAISLRTRTEPESWSTQYIRHRHGGRNASKVTKKKGYIYIY